MASNGVLYGVIIVIIFFLYLIIRAIRNHKKLVNEGILTEATITQVIREEIYDEDGNKVVITTYKLSYRNERGEIVETKLLDTDEEFYEGQKVMIKYLDSNPKKVILSK